MNREGNILLDGKLLPPEISDRICILVVEDNILNQKLTGFILNDWGVKHKICSNGKLALDALQLEHFDLILMDIQMPEMNGTDTTEFIRQNLKLNIPIIAMTAHALPGERERCMKSGMTEYLTKPINEEELHQIIVKYLISPAHQGAE